MVVHQQGQDPGCECAPGPVVVQWERRGFQEMDTWRRAGSERPGEVGNGNNKPLCNTGGRPKQGPAGLASNSIPLISFEKNSIAAI